MACLHADDKRNDNGGMTCNAWNKLVAIPGIIKSRYNRDWAS